MGSCCCKPVKVTDDATDNVDYAEKSQASQLQVLRWPAGAEGGSSSQGSGNGSGIEKVASTSSVKVAVVVRPLLPFEMQGGAKDIVSVTPPSKITLPQRTANGGALGDSYDFAFDRVYRADGAASSSKLHEEMVRNVLDRFCQGFNGTILAYGQTGSGKTYTMGTAATAKELAAAAAASNGAAAVAVGVVPRAVHRVFEYLAHAAKLYETSLKVTYVEIYNEQVQDLLASPFGLSSINNGGGMVSNGSSASLASAASSPARSSGGGNDDNRGGSSGGSVVIREAPSGAIMLDGVVEARVGSKEEVIALLSRGNERRSVAAHKLNDASSRSHAVLTMTLEQRARPGAAGVPRELRYLKSKLSLVDLAGSERAKQTGATGARFQEGVAINSGLLALGNVINALSEQQRGAKPKGAAPRRHIPYRDSKLTRLLQDGLGGNSETLFIACVSPGDASHEHTVGTLRYASRAMLISNSLQLNNTMTAEEEIAFLRSALEAAQSEVAALKSEVATLQTENTSLRQQRQH